MKLTVKKVKFSSRDRGIWSAKEQVGEVLFPSDEEVATLVARGERYKASKADLRLKKGDEEVLSAVEAKGVWCSLTTEYMGHKYVMDYTDRSGWIVRSGVAEVGRLSFGHLAFKEDVPLLLQLYLLWYILEHQPDIDSRKRAVKVARCCGLYRFG
ncbi:unnamed protein product [Ostreobium quekettii]|uniref:Uncharacterized protein n=1 Tax=Ostreobium quekettii TaxID=121088 RepID=A0A8S1JCR8_9CHLO|nr:unnamed protein product [Ostreobium quekettii]|eukprot:evm.model.scf_2397.2 EVM.evm.TU.scf_2397.2   scf_2397:5571-6035(-)